MAAEPDGRQARWARHNRQRRREILDAACRVIEDAGPGAEFRVQQIADQAGLNRTVVYRHFTDRADLDRAIRGHILDDFTESLIPTVSLEGTVHEIIHRIISTYVDYVVAHPALHAFALLDSAGPFEQGIDRISATVAEVLEMAIGLLGAELDEAESALVDPLAYGLAGAVFGAVRRWVSREPRRPSARRMAELLSLSVWNLLDGHARRLGLEIDPNSPLVELLADPDEATPDLARPAGGSAEDGTP